MMFNTMDQDRCLNHTAIALMLILIKFKLIINTVVDVLEVIKSHIDY